MVGERAEETEQGGVEDEELDVERNSDGQVLQASNTKHERCKTWQRFDDLTNTLCIFAQTELD